MRPPHRNADGIPAPSHTMLPPAHEGQTAFPARAVLFIVYALAASRFKCQIRQRIPRQIGQFCLFPWPSFGPWRDAGFQLCLPLYRPIQFLIFPSLRPSRSPISCRVGLPSAPPDACISVSFLLDTRAPPVSVYCPTQGGVLSVVRFYRGGSRSPPPPRLTADCPTGFISYFSSGCCAGKRFLIAGIHVPAIETTHFSCTFVERPGFSHLPKIYQNMTVR